MRRAVLLALTACSFQHGTLATDAASGDAGPDAPDGSSTAGDSDGDGIPDATDLCPMTADPLQRDHDGDGFGDACDGCPPFTSASNDDGDGDGVGDACDPRPSTAGDTRALWIGFYAEDAQRIANTSEWLSVDMWTVGSGWVSVTAGSSVAVLRYTTDIPRALAFTSMRLDDYTNGNAAAGLVTGAQGSPNDITNFYQCGLFRSGPSIGARSQVDDVLLDDNYEAWGGSVENGAVIDVVARFTNMFDCRFSPPQSSVGATASTTAGDVEVLAQRASVSFDYLFVVGAGS